MPIPLVHSIEEYVPEFHAGILMASAIGGCDTTPAVFGRRYIGFGNTKFGYGPACVIDDAGTAHVAEPHVIWFPWTSPADRIINFKWAMSFLAQTREVLLTVQKDQISFFEHFVKRGILRKIGHLENMPIVEEIHMYQYRRSIQ